MARSTLANLLAGNSLPRRPGLVVALVEVLTAELNEPGQTLRYQRAWSRLIAACGGGISQWPLATSPHSVLWRDMWPRLR